MIMTHIADTGSTVAFVIVLIGGYWAPTITAWARHVPNRGSVAVINGFLGWTVVGWVVALAMACRSQPHLTSQP